MCVSKRFGSTTALDDVSLTVTENEFFALLGPSGCGKTTLLRTLAGFEAPQSGRIMLDGKDITAVRANRRPLNLMFQSYALFPHMTVEKNIAYGLEMEKLPGREIEARVQAVMETTQLGVMAKRRPDQLSGGQRQRVALARALVKQPRVLLLDEPLAALDKKLREEMQLELKRLQHEVGITFLVVTHDQEEALVMADRIAVLDSGRVVQIGTPRELYEHPRTRFVASFIGVMNFFEGIAVEGGVEVAGLGSLEGDTSAQGPATLAVRPERISLSATRPDGARNALPGTVTNVAYHGTDVNVRVTLPAYAGPLVVRVPASSADSLSLDAGARVWCHWHPAHSRIIAQEAAVADTGAKARERENELRG